MPGGGLISDAVGGLLDGMMREIWTGTLALLRAVMGLVGELGSLDITPGGGAISNELWTTMLQLAALIAVTLFFAQLAAAALNPRRHMFQAATGPVQYGVALALSVAVVAGLLGAADGLSAVILAQGANVTDTAAAMDQLGLVDDNNAVKATVLGLLGIIAVVPLAIGYGITLLFRSASILVLVATLPITAAGLTNLATKSWFWRVARWLLALIFLKPAFALCFALGSGIVAAAGRTAGPNAPPAAPVPPGAPAEGLAPADGSGVVTLLLGLGIMFVALFAPYALFRLFAFIEPGTQPHQAMMSAFSSATAGLKSTVSGAANADIGSVLSGATGGRFAGDAGGSGLGGMLSGSGSGGGSGGSGDDAKKQQAAAAGLAVATGGASAAAGAGAAGGASSGAAGSSGAGAGGATRPVTASAGAGSGGGGQGTDSAPDTSQVDTSEEDLTGAGAAASGGGGGVSGGTAGTTGAAGGSGGGWSVASKAAAATSSVGSGAGGRVGAAAQALGGTASGVGAGAAGIGGALPMAPAPMGGVAGSVGDHGLGDYSGGHLGASAPRAPISPRTVHSYRDESFDPERHYRDEGDDGWGDGGDDHGGEGMAGVIR